MPSQLFQSKSGQSKFSEPTSVSLPSSNFPEAISVCLLAQPDSDKHALLEQLDSSRYHATTVSSIDALVAHASDQDSSPDIVLVCIELIAKQPRRMIEFLRHFLIDHYAPILMLANACDNDVLVEAMAAGAHDFVITPIAPPLLEAKIAAQLRMSQMKYVVHQQHQQLVDNHSHLIHEQALAKEVFNKVARDNGVEIANICHWLSPIAVFNGDVLLAAPTPNGGLMVLLGDFTGHGLAAAIGAIPLASTFYSMVGKGFTMQDIIKELNNKLHELLPVSVFCCASMAQFNFEQGVVDIWNAGLPDCYILRHNSPVLEVVSSNALALGIVGGSSFDAQPTRFHMDKGDRLYFLSDGVLEATDSSGEQFGDQRLMQVIAQQSGVDAADGFAAIKQQLVEFIGEHARTDDISLVEVSMVDAEDFAEMYHGGKGHVSDEPVSWRFDYRVRPASLQHQDPVPLLLHMLMEVPNLRRYSGQLFTIISELYNNALDHGLLGLASSLKQQTDGFTRYYNERIQRLRELNSGSVDFTLDYQGDARQGVLLLEVRDSGQGFDYSDVGRQAVTGSDGEAVLGNLHGRGIPLLQSICSKVEYLGCGNHARVEFRWEA